MLWQKVIMPREVLIMYRNELCHHGVLGMKWGVRKYQNKDGSLTSEGRKRAAGSGYEKRGSIRVKTKNTYKVNLKPQTKKASDMSDAELRDKINRKKLENEYNRLYRSNVSLGRKTVNRVLNDVIIRTSVEIGKQYLKQQMYKKLDL